MTEFYIGEIEKLTGIKSHILRYWEENIPILNPRKDSYNRRLYSQRDLEFIFRLKFLITEKKFTVDGAGEQLLNELQETKSEKTQISNIQISQMRNHLLNIYKITQKDKNEK